MEDASVLDLFAGTGSLGIEALSRGAENAVFIDKSEECIKLIKENLIHTKLLDKSMVIKGEVAETLKKLIPDSKKYDLIFLDPPYNKGLVQETLTLIDKYDLIKSKGIIIAEKDVDDKVPTEIGRLILVSEHKYGDTVLVGYKARG